MVHFQIYVPHKAGFREGSPEILSSVGLSDLATDFDYLPLSAGGPDGGAGTLFGWLGQHQPLIVGVDRLQWHAAVPWGDLPAGRYWIGWDPHELPTPAVLKRRYEFPGWNVPLGDGRTWSVPEPRQLPLDILLADDGSIKFEQTRRFGRYTLDAGFVAETDRWRELVAARDVDDPEDNLVEFEEAFRFGVEALRVNYRMTPELASALRVFNTRTVCLPIMAAIGVLGSRQEDGDG